MKERFQNVREALKDRITWEDRQRVFYAMRHNGIRRRNKPHTNAADLHCKLFDTSIEKMKPFYHQQLFAAERLVQFVSLSPDQAKMAEAASVFLDYHLREETNFETELLSATDHMLVGGRGIIKTTWDPRRKALRYESIDPLMLVVPWKAPCLEEADWFCEVQILTVAQYRRDPRFANKDEAFIKRITGGQKENGVQQQELEKQTREGFTHSKSSNEIIVWTYWENLGNQWHVYTISPACEEHQLRPAFVWPLKLRDEIIIPYGSLVAEVKDKGWYSPRGLGDRLGALENYYNKVWNTKSDFLDYATRPSFTGSGPIGNAANVRLLQGEILPGDLRPIEMPKPPMDLDMEMQNIRQIAEQNIMVPDFGIGGSQGNKDSRTATEVGYIQNIAGTGIELKGRVYRLGPKSIFKASWATLLLNRDSSSQFVAYSAKEVSVLPEQAFHDSYLISPDGSPDAWNKSVKLQRAVARLHEFRNDPDVNQEELKRGVINADDPKLTDKLVIPRNIRAASEAEDEAMEVSIMMDGFPASAKPDEDHITRIQILLGKLEQLRATNTPVNPIAMQRLSEHIGQHIQLLKQQNPDAAQQVMQIIAGLMAPAMPQPAPQIGAPGPVAGPPAGEGYPVEPELEEAPL